MCGLNQHYEVATSACQPTCTDLNPRRCEPQVEGCVCNDGYVLSGTECVTLNDCGCSYKGLYYKVRFLNAF